MHKISTNELLKKWEKSKKKINELLLEKDKNTINLIHFYKLYSKSPRNKSLKSLFEYSFYGWFNENIEGGK